MTVFLEHHIILKDSRSVVRITMRQRVSISLRGQLIAAARGSRSEEPSIPREPASTVISPSLPISLSLSSLPLPLSLLALSCVSVRSSSLHDTHTTTMYVHAMRREIKKFKNQVEFFPHGHAPLEG